MANARAKSFLAALLLSSKLWALPPSPTISLLDTERMIAALGREYLETAVDARDFPRSPSNRYMMSHPERSFPPGWAAALAVWIIQIYPVDPAQEAPHVRLMVLRKLGQLGAAVPTAMQMECVRKVLLHEPSQLVRVEALNLLARLRKQTMMRTMTAVVEAALDPARPLSERLHAVTALRECASIGPNALKTYVVGKLQLLVRQGGAEVAGLALEGLLGFLDAESSFLFALTAIGRPYLPCLKSVILDALEKRHLPRLRGNLEAQRVLSRALVRESDVHTYQRIQILLSDISSCAQRVSEAP